MRRFVFAVSLLLTAPAFADTGTPASTALPWLTHASPQSPGAGLAANAKYYALGARNGHIATAMRTPQLQQLRSGNRIVPMRGISRVSKPNASMASSRALSAEQAKQIQEIFPH